MSEGSHVYHTGVSYTEHHGTEISLVFGQEMNYIVGSENTTVIGMESRLNIGAIADVGLVTKVELEFGAEIQWVGGWHFVMAEHGGGVFDHVFSVTAGSTDLTAFKKLKFLLKAIVAAQVIAAAGFAIGVKTLWVPKIEHTDEVKIDGNSGFFAITTVNAQVLSLATVILTVALYWLLKKQSDLNPMSAMSINHQGYGFLGVSATQTGGAVAAGSSGLALSPQAFKLSFDGSQRAFNRNHGHEIIGFNTDGASVITGDSNGVAVTSNKVNVTTTTGGVSPSTATFFLTPGALTSLATRNISANAGLTTQPGEAFVYADESTSGGSKMTLKPNSVEIHSSTVAAANASLALANGTATLESLNSSAKVDLSNKGAILSFGAGNEVKVDSMGVSIASGAVTILSPTVPIPDVAQISTIAADQAKAAAVALQLETKKKLDELKESLEATVKEKIAGVIRTVETKIGEGSVQAGAK